MAKKESFHKQLILNNWILKKFKGGTFDSIKNRIQAPQFEGVEENGNTEYFLQLTHFLEVNANGISKSKLEEYDRNVLRFWKEITLKRNKVENTILHMKYFQYLSLLFTEIYLDWYFNHSDQLLNELNEELKIFNNSHKPNEQFQVYVCEDLNKIAFWNATGSGKTLLLHVNIKQYLHYFQTKTDGSLDQDKYPDKIIVLTPNEGLSKQHLEEFQLSGMPEVALFDKNNTQHRGFVEIIDVNKLGEEMGDKVVAVEAFEGNNLVLVDEGHRGTSGGSDSAQWLKRREALCKGGFSFEYSATFGQAVAKSKTVGQTLEEIRKKSFLISQGCKNQKEYVRKQYSELPTSEGNEKFKNDWESYTLSFEEQQRAKYSAPRETYAKCVLFDYSYKFFYEDGYGKESLILNLPKDKEEEIRNTYLIAAVLSFYKQKYIYNTQKNFAQEFNIADPFWIFVGHSVSAEESDVMSVLRFLNWFTLSENRIKIVATIKDLLNQKPLIVNTNNTNVFEKQFSAIQNLDAEEVYLDIFLKVFNSPSQQLFKVVNLKGVSGEIGLRVGDNPFFGVINIGDTTKVFKNCEADEYMQTEETEQVESLFKGINKKDSQVNLLVGSKKFTEGWSSWRVSSMGLLNMGKSEGSQIIQLFGRGVRLKGKDFTLQRTGFRHQAPKGSDIKILETLNIFGIKADYIATFKDYLREEGITPSDEIIQIDFDTQVTLPSKRLKTLKLKDGYNGNQSNSFKRKESPYLFEIPEKLRGKLKPIKAQVDLFSKVESISTSNPGGGTGADNKEVQINVKHLAFVNWDKLYLKLLEFKNQKSWYNLKVDKEKLKDFVLNAKGWYVLRAPESKVKPSTIKDYKALEDILWALLQDYVKRFYGALKSAYEEEHYEYAYVEEDDTNFIKNYVFDLEADYDAQPTTESKPYYEKLSELKQIVESGDVGKVSTWQAPHMEAIVFDSHLYYPLMNILEKDKVPLKMKPLAFDAPSEVDFVKKLKSYYDSKPEILKGKSIYMLRNSSHKSKGIGFTTAGNFYPDFLVWIVDEEEDKQYLVFVDPKGLRNMAIDDAKFKLSETLEEVEKRLADSSISLHAYILSGTSFEDLTMIDRSDPEARQKVTDAHILFMDEEGYLEEMFKSILNKEALLV